MHFSVRRAGRVALLLLFSASLRAQTLKGTVLDATTDEPLPDAHVVLPDADRGTYTDASGRFELQRPAGARTLRVTFVGYDTL
ncbi:MAG: carboxypeptidase-like regulatory domain-containing protein, partial [Catalinimonas sp.]